MTGTPICVSSAAATCYDVATVSIPQPGYYCQMTDTCVKCPIGTYGIDGKTCNQCPFGTWAPNTGQSSCSSCFSYSSPGLQQVYIPYGVTHISVKLWGGGGGGGKSLDTTYVSHSGGGGGFTSCNVSVVMSSNIYVIIAGGGGAASLSTNAGGYGGGGKGYSIPGYSAGGGGGRSAVQLVVGTDAVTAGGGGGGADCLKTRGCGGGGGGGAFGQTPRDTASGRGGTLTRGGAAGFGFFCNGTAGSQYLGVMGGNGCRSGSTSATAGGGGGYYGGGGGSSFGTANTSLSTPPVYPADGGGGGGVGFVGGCTAGSFYSLPGITGNSSDPSHSGGVTQTQYVQGVGVGGAAGGVAGGAGYVTVLYLPDKAYLHRSPHPSSSPSSRPTGQPTNQPSSRPTHAPSKGASKRPTGQPTSRPTGVTIAAAVPSAPKIGELTTAMAIIVFSSIGAAVLCIFIVFTCYFQFKYLNKEGETVHSLVEETFDQDEVAVNDGEGGAVVDSESMFYRQFGDIDCPIHLLKDKDGNFIPGTARSTGAGGLLRKNSMHGYLNGSFTGRSRQSLILRKSFGAASVPGTPPKNNTILTHRSMGDFSKQRGSFGSNNSNRQKLVTRTSISTIGAGSFYAGDGGSVIGDISSGGALTGRALNTSRSQSQIMSLVRVKSFVGGGPAPRLVKMLQPNGSAADIARVRYLAEHEGDVQGMQNFFRRSGLSMQKSIACAEEAICLDANSPRKLFKYVHEVAGFSLMNLGMDRIDAELVLEVLNNEFSRRDISAASAAAVAVAKMMGGTGSTYGHSRPSSAHGNKRTTTISMVEKQKPEVSGRAQRIAEHEDDVLDMQEFFRYSGLSVTLSRECAEQAICMDANSPKKLLKYLEEVKGFNLTDLGMDILEADMVLKTLKKEFGVTTESDPKPRAYRHPAPQNPVEYDYKSDSSEDYDEKTESLAHSLRRRSSLKDGDIQDDEKITYDISHESFLMPSPRRVAPGRDHAVPHLKAQPKEVPPTLPPTFSYPNDPHDAFKAKVRAALEYQGSAGKSSPTSSASMYYSSSVHSREVSDALNNLPLRSSSSGRDLGYGYGDEEEKDLHAFLNQVSTAAQATGRTGRIGTSREQSYEESMGMDSSAVDSGYTHGRRRNRVTCYFTHDWSNDELQRSNQEQMLLIDEELRNRGMTTCVDKSSQPSAYSALKRETMQEDIDKSESILIFVTAKFMAKVNGIDGNNDICKLEYDYALRTASNKLVVVILEERMRNISQWKGALRKCIGDNTKVIDLVEQDDEEVFNMHMDKLARAVAAVQQTPRGR